MSDIKIENKDISVLPNGYTKTISGFDYVVQQIEIAASVRKGGFAYDRNLGLFEEAPDFESGNIISTLESLINEALISSDVYVTVKGLRKENDSYYAEISISDGFREKETEVKIYG